MSIAHEMETLSVESRKRYLNGAFYLNDSGRRHRIRGTVKNLKMDGHILQVDFHAREEWENDRAPRWQPVPSNHFRLDLTKFNQRHLHSPQLFFTSEEFPGVEAILESVDRLLPMLNRIRSDDLDTAIYHLQPLFNRVILDGEVKLTPFAELDRAAVNRAITKAYGQPVLHLIAVPALTDQPLPIESAWLENLWQAAKIWTDEDDLLNEVCHFAWVGGKHENDARFRALCDQLYLILAAGIGGQKPIVDRFEPLARLFPHTFPIGPKAGDPTTWYIATG